MTVVETVRTGFLVGSPIDGAIFEHVSSDPEAIRLLVGAFGGHGSPSM